jgi:hypothetical protein
MLAALVTLIEIEDSGRKAAIRQRAQSVLVANALSFSRKTASFSDQSQQRTLWLLDDWEFFGCSYERAFS